MKNIKHELHPDVKNSLLLLLRLGCGNHANAISDANDWQEIKALAARQGLLAVALDGVECLPERLRPTKELLLHIQQ